MKHMSNEEMIELYYGEGTSASEAHVKGCRQCSAQYAELKGNLDAIGSQAVPQRSADYGIRVWESLRPQLIPYEEKALPWRALTSWKAAGALAVCAILLAAVFIGGRYWERFSAKTTADSPNTQTGQRVVLVVLTDHLERSERMLVQLEHAGPNDRADNMQLQSEARELLASNRLYRVTASNAGDPELAAALDRLEGVLAEISNDPNLSATDINRVRKDMNTKGILFEIRILRSRPSDQESEPRAGKGVTI